MRIPHGDYLLAVFQDFPLRNQHDLRQFEKFKASEETKSTIPAENCREPGKFGNAPSVGSGVAEVANKTLVANGMKGSGICGSMAGGQAAPGFRAMIKSGRFDRAREAMAANYSCSAPQPLAAQCKIAAKLNFNPLLTANLKYTNPPIHFGRIAKAAPALCGGEKAANS